MRQRLLCIQPFALSLYTLALTVAIITAPQGRIQPVTLGGRIQSYPVVMSHYEFTTVRGTKYTSQHCCNNGRQNGLISWMLFSELYKIMVNKVTFEGFGGIVSPWTRHCCIAPAPCWSVLGRDRTDQTHIPQTNKQERSLWTQFLCLFQTGSYDKNTLCVGVGQNGTDTGFGVVSSSFDGCKHSQAEKYCCSKRFVIIAAAVRVQ